MPIFVEILQTAAEIWRFYSKMAAVRLFEFVMCVLTTHEKHLVVFNTVQTLVGRCSSFDNRHVFRFHAFGFKTHVHAPKSSIGGYDSLNGEQYQRNPQKAHPRAE